MIWSTASAVPCAPATCDQERLAAANSSGSPDREAVGQRPRGSRPPVVGFPCAGHCGRDLTAGRPVTALDASPTLARVPTIGRARRLVHAPCVGESDDSATVPCRKSRIESRTTTPFHESQCVDRGCKRSMRAPGAVSPLDSVSEQLLRQRCAVVSAYWPRHILWKNRSRGVLCAESSVPLPHMRARVCPSGREFRSFASVVRFPSQTLPAVRFVTGQANNPIQVCRQLNTFAPRAFGDPPPLHIALDSPTDVTALTCSTSSRLGSVLGSSVVAELTLAVRAGQRCCRLSCRPSFPSTPFKSRHKLLPLSPTKILARTHFFPTKSFQQLREGVWSLPRHHSSCLLPFPAKARVSGALRSAIGCVSRA